MNIESLLSREEIRRLEKAAKDKNKDKLKEWAMQFENQLYVYYEKQSKDFEGKIKDYYEKEYQKVIEYTVESFLIAIAYTLHFNEKCKFGNSRINDFMNDLMAVVDGFKTGEYSPEDYKKILKEQKIYYN